ncbi:MAG: Kdo hydroxylase family protein [Gammaproteobacteria bacterium]|nr:Kdo hydroxylase family protein [Gammaproteobacteria bacterium]
MIGAIVNRVHPVAVTNWSPAIADGVGPGLKAHLESGEVLWAEQLGFTLAPEEWRFIDPRWADGRAKNISYDTGRGQIKGAIGNRADLDALRTLMHRFHRQATGLIEKLLPGYAPQLRGARTSLRLLPVAERAGSWRKDDRRLHVDAFPSRPLRGWRILRVFTNVNLHGQPRRWRVGEPFADLAARFWPRLARPVPGAAALLAALHITRGRRSAYDHYMLRLHDAMKADARYQADAPQQQMDFPPGSTWICFSDQTPHAAMAGQHLLEQTLYLPPQTLADPGHGPLAVLERLAGRSLV